MEREDNFRLKRFKELKMKKNKGDDDKKYPCYCDKKPGKGDDFICDICKQEQDKNKSKKKTCEFKSSSSISEVIGDKASTLNTANQKRLDDLTAHLEKVISLTSQCKTEGLVSPSVDTFIYACREVRDKLEETCDKSNATESATCSACEGESPVLPTLPCNTCSESKKTEMQQESVETQDSFGCFETKYKEIVKVKKYKNEDGTVSEEKQVITVKTERKFPQNSLSNDPCFKIKAIDFKSDNGDKDDSCACKKSKSENIQNDVKRNQTNIRPCVSDSGDNRKISPSKSECCKIFDASTNPKTPSVTSNEVCPKKCSSANTSIKSKVSRKSSKSSNKSISKSSNKSASKKSSKKTKKDVCSECRVEITSVCCDSMWKDVACSTTGLAENSEKEEELCISIKESELVEPNKELDNPSAKSKSSANKEELCCDTNEIEIKSSLPRDTEVCSKNSKLSNKSSKDVKVKKDVSVTTSNIILIDEQEKPNSVKSQPCCNTANNLRKTDVASKTCCKIKIISKQKTGQGNKDEKVQEIIFFGSILDAVKKILAPNNSQDNIKKTSNDLKTQDDVPKSCSCTSQNLGLPPKTLATKFSAKSSVCKTCETASKVPSDDVQSSVYGSCKGMEKSQSCPQCHAKNEEKSITWSRQRSQSEQNTCSSSKCPKNLSSKPVCCGCKRYIESVSKCSVCGSILSKSKSNATSFPSRSPSETDKTSCISCNESYSSILKNNTRSEHSNNVEASDLCSSMENTVSNPTCKTCQTDRPSRKVQPKPSQKLSQTHSCPVSNQKTSQNQEIKKLDDSSCPSARKAKPAKSAKSLCCGFTPRSSRDASSSQKETPGTTCAVEMVDASTSTRRSDRYDVRPLKMMKFNKQPTCTCHSDSYLIERAPRNPRRSKSCSSCHGDYYR